MRPFSILHAWQNAGSLALLAALSACSPALPPGWASDLPELGSYSSPRAADLTGDGVLDIVVGAGKNEFAAAEGGVLAFDGKDGRLLWQAPCQDQVVGSAQFLDINRDGRLDVIIGGRSRQLMALDGRSGALLWKYEVQSRAYDAIGMARFNFYNTQLLPDQDGDGLRDVLAINGGNVLAQPYDSSQRYPGVLMLLSSASGAVIAADTMPDGRESYCSPVVLEMGGEWQVIFGTGGETLGGHLYIAPLSALRAGSLRQARVLLREEGQGFVAPPTLADLDGDGFPELLANSHAARVFAYDLRGDSLRWQRTFAGVEANACVAIGHFNGDAVPDCFVTFCKGTWPDNYGAQQWMLDGRDGSPLWGDSLGCVGFSSPLAADLDGDGLDEAIFSSNEFPCARHERPSATHTFWRLSLAKGRPEALLEGGTGKNVASTPWLGDLDGDGKLDFVYCLQANALRLHEFYGIRVACQRLDAPALPPPATGAYMGNAYDGHARLK